MHFGDKWGKKSNYNAVLAGLPRTATEPLQRAQNAAARLLFASDPVITLPQRWLNYTGCRFSFALNSNCACLCIRPWWTMPVIPRCTSEFVGIQHCSRPGLRSASSSSYLKPRLRTKLGERAFSFCGPAEWNCLPSELQMITDTTSFKKKLKAHFYNQAFCVD